MYQLKKITMEKKHILVTTTAVGNQEWFLKVEFFGFSDEHVTDINRYKQT
jgi:hypothetical protein